MLYQRYWYFNTEIFCIMYRFSCLFYNLYIRLVLANSKNRASEPFGTLRETNLNFGKPIYTSECFGSFFWICFSCYFVATMKIGGNRFLSGNSMWKSVFIGKFNVEIGFYREIQCGNRFLSGNSMWKSVLRFQMVDSKEKYASCCLQSISGTFI